VWLKIGPLSFQPSELCKLSLCFLIAKIFSTKKNSPFQINSHYFYLSLIPTTFFAIFLIRQPDLGSLFLLCAVTITSLYCYGLKFRHLCYIIAVLTIFASLAIYLEPYRMRRVLSFLNPWNDINKGGFQIIQSYLAFQNGGLTGTGLGSSKQSLLFLPEAHNDFILAVIGEELGVLGVLLVFFLYLTIIFCGYRISMLQARGFLCGLAFTLTSTLALQALFNMGVVTGLLPTKGISLPMISSGSSSLLFFSLSIALLTNLNWNYAGSKK
jgi:Bacterial cell division membrane protein